ncbi:alpha-2-macroglobulin family protein [Stagnihabitans tardus]|uniref:Alpha-2-macroglobulin family protein n=1 Tax=Stagnihabitans tardus TaxID=2699202 RepID=A0AAE4Y7E6_9RHOB|nr:alpha-2-macroglobulin family protein [Stagnihabitans tardus]NBZ86529.1 alpha-2-macroglobulin family protein [Stagnihabitans tardus]
MRGLILRALALTVALTATPVVAEDLIPARRLTLMENTDLPGGDLSSIFDTDLAACETACLANASCEALVFNGNNGSCFLKSGSGAPEPFDGAWAGYVIKAVKGTETLAQARKAELKFVPEWDWPQATYLARGMADRHVTGLFTADDHLNSAAATEADGDYDAAWRFTGAALNLDDSAANWLEYARRLMLAADNDPNNAYALRNDAYAATLNAWARSEGKALQHSILVQMGLALETLGRGSDEVKALRLAQSLQPRDDTAALLTDALGKYGFRITENQTQTRTDRPRLCAIFSEELAASGVDYTPFVQLPEPGMSVAVEGTNQLCVEGIEYGARYTLTFRQGLPSAGGESLGEDTEITAYVRDRDAGVRFSGRGYVLPRTGTASIPVVTVNLKEVDLQIWKVTDRNLLRAMQNGYFDQPIYDYQEYSFQSELASMVWEGKGEVGQELNKDVTTRLPLDEAIAGQPAGIYALRASVPGKEAWQVPAAWQWFVISDLGLASYSGVDGLNVFVHGLGDAKPRAGVAVQLLSVANDVLGTATTDEAGRAVFDAGLTRGEGSAAPGLLVASTDADQAFLSLTDPEFDLSDRGVEGNPAAPPVDVFLYTDRGAYRAGETVHAVALSRDAKQEAIEGMPLTAILTRPDGVEYVRAVAEDAGAGGHVFDFPVAGGAPRGQWRMDVYGDLDAPALASKTFLVEDFLPERIDFKLDAGEAALHLGETPQVSVDARYLFGAPGADLAIEGELLLQRADGLADWPGYEFGRWNSDFSTQVTSFSDYRTDEAGKAVLDIALPQVEDPGIPLQALIAVRVAEGSGRPVERRVTKPLAASAPMIGVKPLFDQVVAENAEARFALVGVGTDGKATAMKASWTLTRVETDYQWYQTEGNWYYEPITRREKVGSGEVDLAEATEIAAPVTWGEYELAVTGTDAVTTVQFYAGWYGSGSGVDTPDALELSLDKPTYAVGETATLRIAPKAAGRALVTVLSNGVITAMEQDVVAGENLIPVPVTDDWGTGAYVTATVLRPMDVAAGRNPARQLGLAYATIDPGTRALAATIEVASEAAPRAPLDIAVKVDGVQAGDTAWVTVAAVDQGILNLTAYVPPDPSKHYFGQRKLGVGLRDIYGRLIDGLNGAEGAVRSGGDAGANARLKAPPPTEELVAHFAGPVVVGEDGRAHVSFDIPAFNGTVKVMAVAWSKRGIGQASADVLIRDPVVVTASLPRFLTPGDQSRLLLEVVHAKGPSGKMGLSVTSSGVTLGKVPAELELADQGKAVIEIPVTAGPTGDQVIEVALTTPDGKVLTKTLHLPVQVNDPLVSRVTRLDLAKGQSFTFDENVFAGLLPGSGKAVMSVGPLARLNAPGVLAALDAYPYGCTEQITSKALPLLYFDQVAQAMDLPGGADIRGRVQQAVTEVLTNQDANGAFGLWGPGSGDMWLDAYVTDFLSRAKAQGIEVPDLAFRMALDNLRNQVNYFPDFDMGGEALAYGLMVLAREGAAAVGDLRYYADQKGDAFATPTAMAQLGAALAMYGDQPRADRMFAKAVSALGVDTGSEQLWRADYGTAYRDAAAVLTLAVEAGSKSVDVEALTSRIATQGRLSTQEATWTLLAANALITAPDTGITLNGEPASGPMVKVLDASLSTPVVVETAKDTTVTVTTFGVPTDPVKAGGNGYAITRSYYTLKGEPAGLDGAKVGDRVVVVLEVTPFGRGEARLMVNDPLPAGFEIDNPNLISGGAVSDLSFLDLAGEVSHSEFRQDRFLAAIDRMDNGSFRLAYIVRAVSPGTYHQPAASVEDMYRPDLNAHSDQATVTVQP